MESKLKRIEAKYKVGEKVQFNHLGEGIREGVVFGTYNLKGKLRYSIRDHSGVYAAHEGVLYTMNEDEIIEKIS
jgi:hypothetical protein